MKQILTVIMVSALAVSGCAQKGETVTLKEGTPAYALAKELGRDMPALGPDKTTVVVETKGIASPPPRSSRPFVTTSAPGPISSRPWMPDS